MRSKGPAKTVAVFVNEDTRHGTEPLRRAALDRLLHKQVAVISDVEIIRLAHPSIAMEVIDAGNTDR